MINNIKNEDEIINDFSYKQQVLDIINNLELNNNTDKNILKSRFLGEVLKYEERRNHTKKYYNIFRFLVTTGSILLPAILSMGQMDPAKLPKNFENISYWASWTISLMVTGCNGFLQLFSLDKNYFEFAITTEQLKTEGWQYFQLSGKYEEYEDHKEAYKPFCKSIENIKRKQVEKEFPGKADVNKGKKENREKKEFDFQKELFKNLPQQYKIENDSKTKEMDHKMDQLLNVLGNGKELISTVGNVRDILKEPDISVEVTKSDDKKEPKGAKTKEPKEPKELPK
uniref:Uncharacterized protein n=1 Tax=viral metagenome TaxID=1070528 RepID=A0A6C0BSZ4_9ZZZZ